jgi:hypothetical protein
LPFWGGALHLVTFFLGQKLFSFFPQKKATKNAPPQHFVLRLCTRESAVNDGWMDGWMDSVS